MKLCIVDSFMLITCPAAVPILHVLISVDSRYMMKQQLIGNNLLQKC